MARPQGRHPPPGPIPITVLPKTWSARLCHAETHGLTAISETEQEGLLKPQCSGQGARLVERREAR